MTVAVRTACLRDACWCAANMREKDRTEIAAVVSMDEPAAVAALLLHNSGGLAFCAYLHGHPVAVFGVSRLFDHVGGGWAYGTKNMRRAVPAITRHCLDHIAPEMVHRGYRRLEVRTSVDHDLSHKWLAGMGAVRESAPYEFGRNGEMFVTYGWSLTAWLAHPLCTKPRACLTSTEELAAG